jgi:hypothetical protein
MELRPIRPRGRCANILTYFLVVREKEGKEEAE